MYAHKLLSRQDVTVDPVTMAPAMRERERETLSTLERELISDDVQTSRRVDRVGQP